MIDDSASFFTKQERLDRYRKVLERFSSNKLCGFGNPDWRLSVECPDIYLYEPGIQWLHKYTDIDISFCHMDFPEWYAQKPEYGEMSHITTCWADKWHNRENWKDNVIKWLTNAIQITESSIV